MTDSTLNTDLGKQLYQLLPSIYREQDNTRRDNDNNIIEPGDLAKYLQANGSLLTRIYYTVKQQLYDNFPDQAGPDSEGIEQSCQPWMLPYFAALLDVTLVSPDTQGQRAEVANAIAWRQSKGTLPCLESICEAVGQFEVEVQEGWKRVATTARIGSPLLPAIAFAADSRLDQPLPASAKARHPGLPYVTVDLRYASRARQCDPNSPAAKKSLFGGADVYWCQHNHNAAPCFPNSYQDLSKRTVDLRVPAKGEPGYKGLYHPRRLLCYTPVAAGFFSENASTIQWSSISGELNYLDANISIETTTTLFNGEQVPHHIYRGLTAEPLKIRGVIELSALAVYQFEHIWLDNTLTAAHGQLILNRCAARKLVLSEAEREVPVLDARDCLFKTIEVARGQARLEYCTLLEQLLAEVVLISDCILLGRIRKDRTSVDLPERGCIRYSRCNQSSFDAIEAATLALKTNSASCTAAQPVFFNHSFGQPGCGVLQPHSSERIKYGAEDGSEMGAYHHRRYCLKQDAVIDKLEDFLPLGIEAVLLNDPSLNQMPPRT